MNSIMCAFKNYYVLMAAIFVAAIFPLTGCLPKKQEVLQISSGLQGTWKAQDQAWQITIDAKGNVDSVLIPMGRVIIKPNQTNPVKMIDGQISVFEAGNFESTFDPSSKELFVRILIPHLNIKIGDDYIEGSREDVFVGLLSSDNKQWDATWFHIFDYGKRFPMDPNIGVKVIFEKEN